MSAPLAGYVARVAGLAVLWVALWGEPSAANVLAGVVVAVAVLAALPPWHGESVRLDPVAAARFVALFTRLLLASTWEVVTIVVRPRPDVAEGVVAVDLTTRSATVATVVANGISLTPGTLTVEIAPRPDGSGSGSFALLVHVLRLRDAEGVRTTARELEARAGAALGLPAPPAGGVP